MEFLPGISDRLGTVEYQLFESTTNPSKSQYDNLGIVREEYDAYRQLMQSVMSRLKGVEEKLDAIPIPYTKAKGEGWKEE